MKLALLSIAAIAVCSCSTSNRADRIETLEADRARLIDSGLGTAHPKVRQIDAEMLKLQDE